MSGWGAGAWGGGAIRRILVATLAAALALGVVGPGQVAAAATDDQAFAVVGQSDGKLILGGHTYNGITQDLALARYNANGTLDASFDADGRVITGLGSGERITDLAIQTDGKIVGVGQRGPGQTRDVVVVRYNPNGTPDSSFSDEGVVILDLGGDDTAIAVALQPDDRIVAVGSRILAEDDSDIAVVRLTADGKPDGSFDGDGIAFVDFDGRDDFGEDLVLVAGGKIVVAGESGPVGGGDADLALARLKPDGSLDSSFDGDGRVTADFRVSGSGDDQAAELLLQPDGKLVVAGTSSLGNGEVGDFAAARFTAEGALDPTFGSGGRVVTPILAAPGVDDDVQAAALQPDGKIVVVGRSGTQLDVMAVVRYNPNGTLDRTFDKDGKALISFGKGTDSEAFGVVIAGSGTGMTITVGGISGRLAEDISYDFAAVRLFAATGKRDKKFGPKGAKGFVRTDFEHGTAQPGRSGDSR